MITLDERFPVTRRLVLRGAGSIALTGLGLGIASLCGPPALAAANDKYPEEAFKQKDSKEAIRLLYCRTAEPSDRIRLDAPEIAQNGAVVPISISTSLADVTSIAFVVPAGAARSSRPTACHGRRQCCVAGRDGKPWYCRIESNSPHVTKLRPRARHDRLATCSRVY